MPLIVRIYAIWCTEIDEPNALPMGAALATDNAYYQAPGEQDQVLCGPLGPDIVSLVYIIRLVDQAEFDPGL